MAIPRPKILTRFTVPTGGWALKWEITITTPYDQDLDITIPAGDYYVAWDGSASDFLWQLAELINLELVAEGVDSGRRINIYLDSDHKVNILFNGPNFADAGGDNDVRLTWTSGDGASVAAVLGFDGSADDTSTASDNPLFTSDWAHAYGWYAEEDGDLLDLKTEDISISDSLQAVALAGNVTTQHVANRYRNEMSLQMITRLNMYSRDIGYTTAPLDPYARNKPLECWWTEARQGVEFRVYRDGRMDYTTVREEQGTATSTPDTGIADTAKSWTTDPEEHTGKLVTALFDDTVDYYYRFIVDTTAATQLTTTSPYPWRTQAAVSAGVYYITDQRFQTYVLDLEEMNEFAPTELPAIDRYDITIPLLRFVS